MGPHPHHPVEPPSKTATCFNSHCQRLLYVDGLLDGTLVKCPNCEKDSQFCTFCEVLYRNYQVHTMCTKARKRVGAPTTLEVCLSHSQPMKPMLYGQPRPYGSTGDMVSFPLKAQTSAPAQTYLHPQKKQKGEKQDQNKEGKSPRIMDKSSSAQDGQKKKEYEASNTVAPRLATEGHINSSQPCATTSNRSPTVDTGCPEAGVAPPLANFAASYLDAAVATATTSHLASLYEAAQYYPHLWRVATSGHLYAQNPEVLNPSMASSLMRSGSFSQYAATAAAASYVEAASRLSATLPFPAIPSISALASLGVASNVTSDIALGSAHETLFPTPYSKNFEIPFGNEEGPPNKKDRNSVTKESFAAGPRSSLPSRPRAYQTSNSPSARDVHIRSNKSGKSGTSEQASEVIMVPAKSKFRSVFCLGLQSKEVEKFAEKDLKQCIYHWGYLRHLWRSHKCTMLIDPETHRQQEDPPSNSQESIAELEELSKNEAKVEHNISSHNSASGPKKWAASCEGTDPFSRRYTCEECLAEVENNLNPKVHPELFPTAEKEKG